MSECDVPDTEWVTVMATIEPAGRRTTSFGHAPFTVDDLLEFPDDGNRYELFDGSLLVSPSPTPPHQRIIRRLEQILDDALPYEMEPLSTVNLRVSVKDFYIPDLVVVHEKSVERVGLMFSPRDLLLVVEVCSPSTMKQDEGLKAVAYAQAGIPSYWRIEPDEGPALYVYELEGDRYEPPVVHKAGAVARMALPVAVEFDPAVLCVRR
ncbi:Uma2 family endonuclease [Nonomuraea fuscirosea]|uniref:Uma2 family endonuclease n=1 Tax=Nonomuraea fuscirosea TaxID=1291556 RepID=A0A2T0N9V3_9ACTN|nr:Uma2 family endonuclease [Nonomuraea fuscirosea]PRX69577.1 Uma2 family endonuclease [Nonomuraea fuscirosea]